MICSATVLSVRLSDSEAVGHHPADGGFTAKRIHPVAKADVPLTWWGIQQAKAPLFPLSVTHLLTLCSFPFLISVCLHTYDNMCWSVLPPVTM